MHELPLNAAVHCSDGYAGRLTHLIFDPTTRAVTHLVVKDDQTEDAQDRLAPISLVTASEHNQIRLQCSKADLEKLLPFSEVNYVSYSYDDYSTTSATMDGIDVIPEARRGQSRVVDENIPHGLRALEQGANVKATDGVVGTVGEVILDEHGVVTHFTLQEGHFWGKQEVTLPLTAVDFVDEDTVHLKLNKHAVGTLPAVPIKDQYASGEKPGGIELVARLYDAPDKAAEALEFLRGVQRSQRGALKIRNSAILIKDADGKLTLTESGDLSPRKGGVWGALAGGLLGALAGPVGIVLGAAAGAGIGAASTHWIDLGFPDEFLTRLQDQLTPGSSALVMLVEHQYMNSLAESLGGLEGVVMQHTLTDEVVDQLLREPKA
jgi:uncharacterized membrane protein